MNNFKCLNELTFSMWPCHKKVFLGSYGMSCGSCWHMEVLLSIPQSQKRRGRTLRLQLVKKFTKWVQLRCVGILLWCQFQLQCIYVLTTYTEFCLPIIEIQDSLASLLYLHACLCHHCSQFLPQLDLLPSAHQSAGVLWGSLWFPHQQGWKSFTTAIPLMNVKYPLSDD